MNILFFDVVPTNIVRFFQGVVAEFETSVPDCACHFLIEEDDENSLDFVRKAYEKGESFSYVERRSLSWFLEFLSRRSIDLVFINGQRLPDDLLIAAAKAAKVPSFMLQHGMYIPFLKRKPSFFVRKLTKTLRFAKYAAELSAHIDSLWGPTFVRYVRAYVFGGNQVDLGIPRARLNVDRVYVYGDYWKHFHTRQFGYRSDQQFVIGYPDLNDIDTVLDGEVVPDSVCYVAQTLVEDGRLDKDLQLRFFCELVDACERNNLNLFIKTHPRSDLSLFEYGADKHHVRLSRSRLPRVDKYVAHYSTLLVKGALISGDVFIWEYPDHPTPDYFREMASRVGSSTGELQDWLASRENDTDSRDIEYYFAQRSNSHKLLVDDVLNHL